MRKLWSYNLEVYNRKFYKDPPPEKCRRKKIIVLGSLVELERQIFREMITELDLTPFEGKPIMIKGCSDATIPQDAYILLVQRLQSVAKSLFYGEACSSVPLWKVKK